MKIGYKSQLTIVFRNAQPKRVADHPDGWILITSGHQFKVFVWSDNARYQRVIRKEAA